MTTDWYSKALAEFKQGIWEFVITNDFNSKISPGDVDRMYSYLVNVGLIDYDVEKDYLWDEYTEEEDD